MKFKVEKLDVVNGEIARLQQEQQDMLRRFCQEDKKNAAGND